MGRLKLVAGSDLPPRVLRRFDVVPAFVEDELEQPNGRYRHRADVPTPGQPLKLRYRLTRWTGVGLDFPASVKARELFAWMERDGERIGALEFVEYDMALDSNADIWVTMDGWSQNACDLATVLCTAWEDLALDVAGYGTIIDFRGAWVKHAHARDGAWAVAANWIVDNVFSDRAILVSKVFAHEYEGAYREGSSRENFHDRRRAALIRFSRRAFGARTFPGEAGREGWMWSPNPRVAKYLVEPGEYKLEL